MRKYRLLAGVVALLVVGAGVLSVTAGGTPAVPPPVTLRGETPDSAPRVTDGLEFVPPTLADFVATTPPAPSISSTSTSTTTSHPPASDTAASPDVGPASEDTAASPEEAPVTTDSADSPDTAASPDD